MKGVFRILFLILGLIFPLSIAGASAAKKPNPCEKKENIEYCRYSTEVLNEMLTVSRLRLAREAQIERLSVIIDKYVDTRYVSHFILGSHLRGLTSANVERSVDGKIKIKSSSEPGQPLTREQTSEIFEEFFQQYKLYFENSFGVLILGTLSGIDNFKINGVEKLEGMEHYFVDISATSSADPSKNFEMRLRVVQLRGSSQLKVIDGVFSDVSFLKTQRDFLEMIIEDQGVSAITSFNEAVRRARKGTKKQ